MDTALFGEHIAGGQITDWKSRLVSRAVDVFGGDPQSSEPQVDLKVQIGGAGSHARFSTASMVLRLFDGIHVLRR